MANTTSSSNFIPEVYDRAFFNIFDPGKVSEKPDPYKVRTIRSGNDCIVLAQNFYKVIPMKDTLWMRLNGQTWEGKVAKAQQDAFEAAYKYHQEQESLDYQVNRLKS